MKYIREQHNLKGKSVILRADLDEPHKGEKLLDDYRILKALPTIEHLRKAGAKIIIISKIGRPKKSFDPEQTLLPAAKRLADLLKVKMVETDRRIPDYGVNHLVFFKGDIRLQENLDAVRGVPAKDIVLLENIRFYPEEENCDEQFAKKLATLGDIYVNDAFAMSHRSEVSVTMLPKLMPAFAGLEIEKELLHLHKVLTLRAKPFVVIMGGAKISDKVGTIKNLAKSADQVLIGGALANLFFLAKGYEIGKSLCEKEKLSVAQEFLRNYKDKLILPTDVVVADEKFENIRYCASNAVQPNEQILDIGPAAILEFSKYIKLAKKMIWNGPLGLFEKKAFSNGTMSIGRLFASKCKGKAFGVSGGGDTLEAINQAKIADQIDFVSTGGGAMLEYLAGEELLGVKALG